ncbi:hypothetical protein BaRGS_00014876 [Batillaria attramentaria]|uniref:Uncharacterized protein n=1 Tax=Batillaria attramentaria TaxID=370345 RepID=A0ABD0L381_9CAEN
MLIPAPEIETAKLECVPKPHLQIKLTAVGPRWRESLLQVTDEPGPANIQQFFAPQQLWVVYSQTPRPGDEFVYKLYNAIQPLVSALPTISPAIFLLRWELLRAGVSAGTAAHPPLGTRQGTSSVIAGIADVRSAQPHHCPCPSTVPDESLDCQSLMIQYEASGGQLDSPCLTECWWRAKHGASCVRD